MLPSMLSDFRYLVVPHTHWDREWYVPFEVFRLRLGTVVDGVLDVLESDESFRSFTLDGQAIVLEDYVELRPEHEERLRALLAAGRLEAGPWYVLPDDLLVGGESLVRNLLLGRHVCRRFGVEPTATGYQPDSFGHPAQLPQLLAGFGLRTFLFSRGLGDQLDDAGVVFRWRAAGVEVVACQFLPHYDNFARLASVDDATERIEQIVERFGTLLERADCDTILLANGSDHLPVDPQVPGLCAELQRRFDASFHIGRYADFEPAGDGLPVYEGELIGSRLQNVLRGVNSARIYLKQANERAERRLLSAETAAALRSLRDHTPFPSADVRLAWRDLLRNHPHDSICGCSCDEVHRDMLVRYEQLERTIEIVERDALGVGEALVNTLPYSRSRLVGDELVGLAGFQGRPAEPLPAPAELLHLEATDDGLAVTDLRTGRRFQGLHALEDEADVGDLYTFCPGGGVRRAALVDARVVRDDELVREVLVDYELRGVRVRTVARVVRGLARVEFRTTVENDATDHRLRVHFPVVTNEQEVRAESQFAVVRRPLEPARPRAEWVEPPVATAHTLGAVALGPLVLLTKGLPEYEAGRDGIRLTLLRCVGTISRPSGLKTRPLAAGPDLSTPDGQCLGTHVFEYALRFDGDELSDAALLRGAQDYRTDFLTGDAFEPPLTVEGDVVFSCLKGAEDGDGLVLRVFNPNPAPARVQIDGAAAHRIRMDEEADLDTGFELMPGEIASFRLVARRPK
jgi:alpha-mannosidase